MQKINRRTFMKYTGALTAIAGMGLPAPAFGEAEAAHQEPLMLYDLTYVYDYDLSDPRKAAIAYDHMHLVACLQGIVNRDRPRLYVKFVSSDEFGTLGVDGYWLDKLRAPGGMLAGRPIKRIGNLDELIHACRQYVRGAVVWDPKVRSTSNVASTVAGVEDLVAIRYDTSPDSLYSRYVDPRRHGQTDRDSDTVPAMLLPAKVWLVNRDGSSKFTGKGVIPGTSLPTTGSAKCDAYWWAKVRYLDTGRCDPGELGYYLDAYWFTQAQGHIQQALLLNRDYLISRRGFVFDLSPWDDETPVDDHGQPLGTDFRTLQAILLSSYQGTNGRMTAVHGFVPWGYKYTSYGQSGGSHAPVASEWQFAKVASAYNAYLDADAEGLDGMANASVYTHNPLESFYKQNPKPTVEDLKARGYVRPDGSVSPRRYVMFYVGDYDSAAWMYHVVPRLWDDPARGSVPLNWAFNPNLTQRISPAFTYTRGTRTGNDFFIAGDSGAGYLNPGMLQGPREYSNLPSGLEAWGKHCERYFRKWDLSVTGFVIDGASPGMNEKALETYSQFSSDGFAAQKIEPMGLVNSTPYIKMGRDLPRSSEDDGASALEGALDGDTSRPPFAPEFHSFRTILESPTWHKGVVDRVHSDLPDAEVEFVDAYTFYKLLGLYLCEVIVEPIKTTLSPGKTMQVVLDVTTYAQRSVDTTLSLEVPSGWSVYPAETTFTVGQGETKRLSLNVTVPQETDLGTYVLTAELRYNGAVHNRSFEVAVVEHSYTDAQEVDVTLGEVNHPNGLVQIDLADGQTSADVVDGRECRRPVFTGSEFSYVYLQVDDTFMFDERNTAAYVTVEYFDAPGQQFGIHYDSNNPSGALNGAYTDAGSIQTTGSNTWKSHTFELVDVRLANRENGGSDLRIYTPDEVCFSKVTVSRMSAA